MKEKSLFQKEKSGFVKLKEVSKEKSDFRKKKSGIYKKIVLLKLKAVFSKKKWLKKEKLDIQK